jgi:Family of unknown function (DUF6159)
MVYQPPPFNAYPPQPGPSGPTRATGKQLLDATWGLLRQDRELLWLPVIAAITGLFAALILFGPGFAIGWFVGGTQHRDWAGWVGSAFAAFAASIVSIYFQAALTLAANQRADGGDPSVRSALQQTWIYRRRILSWAIVSTTLGVAVRALERRLGILGVILGFLSGIAWAIASFFVIPILVVEDLGPIAAVKRSAALIRQVWGTSLRTTLRFGAIQFVLMLAPIAVIVIGVVASASGTSAGLVVGVPLIIVGVAALLALLMVFSAISTYARALIYRYATGRSVPGIDPQLFTGVFRQKRGRRGFA